MKEIAKFGNRCFAEELEEIASGIPVVLVDNSAHAAMCNITALKEAGLWDRQALEALTINGAWQMGLEDERGSIKVGKYADYTILDTNILDFDLPGNEDKLTTIHNCRVNGLYFEGLEV